MSEELKYEVNEARKSITNAAGLVRVALSHSRLESEEKARRDTFMRALELYDTTVETSNSKIKEAKKRDNAETHDGEPVPTVAQWLWAGVAAFVFGTSLLVTIRVLLLKIGE